MSQPAPVTTFKRVLLGLACLVVIFLLSPWPGPQAIVHAFLVLAVASSFNSPVTAMVYSAAGGWTVELGLRMYPHLGGTPLANMILCLAAQWYIRNRPPESRAAYWGQLAILQVGLTLLTHALVRLAAGPHHWGWSWLWPLISIPLWGSVAFLFARRRDRRR